MLKFGFHFIREFELVFEVILNPFAKLFNKSTLAVNLAWFFYQFRNKRILLVELAKLFRKYGPGPFESLAALLASPEATAKFAALLSRGAGIARQAGLATGGAASKPGEPLFVE